MSNATPRVRRMTLRRLVAALSALLLSIAGSVLVGVAVAPPAQAAPPSDLTDPIVDQAGVLSDADRARITDAADRLRGEHDIQLWVVFVDTFDGMSNVSWADRTAELSGLGGTDALLSVAVEERVFDFVSYSESLSEGDDEAIGDRIQPLLANDDFAGAAVAATDGLSSELETSYTGLIAVGAVGGVAALGAGGAVLYSRRRKRKQVEEGVDLLRERHISADDLSRQPVDVLDPWSHEVLTESDNAIRAAEDELRLAVDEFGETHAAPFRTALDNAKQGLASSFALRQRLDDNIPETAEERKSMLLQIITTCGDLDAALDEQVESFHDQRNLLINADKRFSDITQRLIELRARMERAQQQLSALVAKHGEQTLSSVLPNIDLARQEVSFAERTADEGKSAMSQPVGKQGPAIAAMRGAQGAIEQAGRLLDAIDHAETNIAAAQTQMPALITEVEEELAEAANLTHDGGGALAAAVTQARTALERARNGFEADPLGTFTALVDADNVLDDALDEARDKSLARTQRTEVLRSAISSAKAKLATANDFVATRRGAVGATARTRLAEAERLLGEARAKTENDPGAATESARRAGTLADQALMAAQGDVVNWQEQNRPPGGGNSGGISTGEAVLGGILIDSLLRGGMSGGRYRRNYNRGYSGGFGGGGFSGGGFSGGGFGGGFGGGGRSSGRRSSGGSFGGSRSSGRRSSGGGRRRSGGRF